MTEPRSCSLCWLVYFILTLNLAQWKYVASYFIEITLFTNYLSWLQAEVLIELSLDSLEASCVIKLSCEIRQNNDPEKFKTICNGFY